MKIPQPHHALVALTVVGVLLAAVPAQASGGFELRMHVDRGGPPPILEHRPIRYHPPHHRTPGPHFRTEGARLSPTARVRELERIFLADGQIDRAEWRILRRELEHSGLPPR